MKSIFLSCCVLATTCGQAEAGLVILQANLSSSGMGNSTTIGPDGALSGTFRLSSIFPTGLNGSPAPHGPDLSPVGSITLSEGPATGGSASTGYTYAAGGLFVVRAMLPGDSTPEVVLSGTFGAATATPSGGGYHFAAQFTGSYSPGLAGLYGLPNAKATGRFVAIINPSVAGAEVFLIAPAGTVPEPASVVLLGGGVACALLAKLRLGVARSKATG